MTSEKINNVNSSVNNSNPSWTGETPIVINNGPAPQASAPPIPPINITINVNSGEQDLPIRPEVLDFAIDMETKLSKNDHKGGWGGMPIEELLAHIEEELGELKAAIQLDLSTKEVRYGAADAANFLMMLAENYADEHEQ